MRAIVAAIVLDALDAELTAALDAFEGETTIFHANLGQKHADAVELCAQAAAGDFRWCRAHRGDAAVWRRNGVFPAVAALVDRLPFFASTGKVAVIVNEAGSTGVEHCDHAFPDLVSEFVWIRPVSSTKTFYVRDAALERRVVPAGARVLWFDDHLPHGIVPGASPRQVSIRVDGVFAPLYRAYIAKVGAFGDAAFDGGVSLARILAAQGPASEAAGDLEDPPR